MRKIKALYTLSGDGKISISKDKQYELYEESYVIDNYGNKLELTKNEILYRFKELK